jgi:hypothetical protein
MNQREQLRTPLPGSYEYARDQAIAKLIEQGRTRSEALLGGYLATWEMNYESDAKIASEIRRIYGTRTVRYTVWRARRKLVLCGNVQSERFMPGEHPGEGYAEHRSVCGGCRKRFQWPSISVRNPIPHRQRKNKKRGVVALRPVPPERAREIARPSPRLSIPVVGAVALATKPQPKRPRGGRMTTEQIDALLALRPREVLEHDDEPRASHGPAPPD